MKLARAGSIAALLALAVPSQLFAAPPVPEDMPPGPTAPSASPVAAVPPASDGPSEPVRVVLVRPAHADPATAEALIRIRGELVSDGFTVVLVDSLAATPAGAEPPPSSAASIGLTFDADAHVADLYVEDRLTNKRLTRRIDTTGAPPDHLAEVLAVRAVELLRASLIELSLEAERPRPSSTPAPSPPEGSAAAQARRWAERALPSARSPEKPRQAPRSEGPMWGLEAGASVVMSPARVGPAVLSFGRLRFAPVQQIELRLAFAGLGTSPRIAGPHGSSATVTQLLGLAQIAVLPWPSLRARPAFSLGMGLFHVAVEGEASFPYEGTHSATWSAAVDAGAGLEVLAGPRIGISMEMHAFLAVPSSSVRFLDQQTTQVATPGLLGSLTLVGWL